MYRYLLVISILCCLSWGCSEKNNPADLWIDDYCVQKTALTQEEGSNTVSARIDGKWQEFELTEFNDDFLKWNFSRRQE
ncbi:MAG: hypothetical protein JW996_04290, partial [Candidatus Cloacimonetes bacterium]|nr:hypothetical protein [Candidatus Cloacimonadota bacterium]